ncbi:MAG: hypothetical protein IPM54_41295 [Polyangiaceae bacterium]|nr:hypothetical protein [Polyangiaceae bacterium]
MKPYEDQMQEHTMTIRRSDNIDAENCEKCKNCRAGRSWDETIAELENQLRAHGVIWPDFVIMHGKNLSCDEALESRGKKDAGLYVVATDKQGNEAKSANIFARKDPHYVGVSSIRNGSAFRKRSRKEG